MLTGPYAPFIVSAYALTALAVGALIAWVVTDYRKQQKLLRDLEARGTKRRSSQVEKHSEPVA